MNRRVRCATQLVILFLGVSANMMPQASKPGVAKSLSQVKFEQDEDVKCLTSATENGDPAAGASTLILKATPNCAVPWHYHTAEEQLIVVRGSVLTEMDGMSPTTLRPGGFAMMPSKAKHQFSCESKSGCVLFVTFDRAYDIFWVKGSQPSKNGEK
jgi:quercetin dioxygenase-like cupin family protein